MNNHFTNEIEKQSFVLVGSYGLVTISIRYVSEMFVSFLSIFGELKVDDGNKKACFEVCAENTMSADL